MPPTQKPEYPAEPTQPNYEAMPDIRQEVPDLIPYLEPDEKVIRFKKFPDANKPADTKLPSSFNELLRLAGADKMSKLAVGGALVASKAQEHEQRQELRLFESVFGRDALIVAYFLKNYYPELLRSTFLTLSSLQGLAFDAISEEEPGKIVHNSRSPDDPVAQELTERLGWGWPYYGSIDSTLLYVKLLAQEAKDDPDFLDQEYIDKNGQRHTLSYSLRSALGFIGQHIQASQLGLVEYKSLNDKGLVNQFWGDSWDSLSHSDGSIANHNQPIAELSVQVIAYDALVEASELYKNLVEKQPKLGADSQKYQDLAANIKQQVISKFWKNDETGGFFVAGLDKDESGNYRQLDTKTCNMGFILNSRLLDDGGEQSRQMVAQTVKVLFSDEMQNVSGLRTLSKNEKRYKPGGYHTGNVWLWVNNWVANGLDMLAEKYSEPDYAQKARELREKTWGVVQKFKKFPEFARGGDEAEPTLNWREVTTHLPEHLENVFTPGTNTIEQPAQDYQAWTIAAYIDALRKNDPLNKP